MATTQQTHPHDARRSRWARRLPAAVLLAATLTLAVACGGGYGSDDAKEPTSSPPAAEAAQTADGGDRGAASTSTACDLLTPELAATVITAPGTPTSDANSLDAVTVSNCRYAAADGSSISLLLRHEPGQGASVDSAIESLRTITYEGIDTVDVPGVGDGALFAPELGGQLNVFDGDDFLVFTGGTLDQLRPLAEAALAS
jgi:hypothetical protein